MFINKIENVSHKIKDKEAQQIILNYFKNNPESMDKMLSGPWTVGEQTDIKISCKYYLQYYEAKICWKFEFDIGKGYLVVDANTGDILDTYFHNGIYTYVD